MVPHQHAAISHQLQVARLRLPQRHQPIPFGPGFIDVQQIPASLIERQKVVVNGVFHTKASYRKSSASLHYCESGTGIARPPSP